MALGVGAALALRPRALWAHEAVWDDLQAASLVTEPIPSTGERLPVIGIGTARRYDVAASQDGPRCPAEAVYPCFVDRRYEKHATDFDRICGSIRRHFQ